jgi:hypothetical protein
MGKEECVSALALAQRALTALRDTIKVVVASGDIAALESFRLAETAVNEGLCLLEPKKLEVTNA